MKKIIIATMLIATVSVASAMPAGHIGGFHGGRTTIIYGGGFYNPWYSPFSFYYGYPFYTTVPNMPSKLDMQITDIKNDYSDRIASVKMDKTLTKQEIREKVKAFKRERNEAIDEAKRNYYKS